MKACSFVAALLLFATLPVKLAAELSPPPKAVTNLTAHPWPQTLVGECNIAAKPITLGATQVISLPEGMVLVHGQDREGHTWKFSFDTAPIAECQLWRFNLSDAGSQALAFISYGTDSSGGADTTLYFLFFDHDDRPIPWIAVGRFTSNDNGIEQLVTADSPTHPQLIVPHEETLFLPNGNETVQAYHLLDLTPEGLQPAVLPAHNSSWPLFVGATKEYIAQEKSYKPSLTFAPPSSDSNLTLKAISTDANNNTQIVLSDGSRHPAPATIIEELPDGSRFLDTESGKEGHLRGLVESHPHVSLTGELKGNTDENNLVLWVIYPAQ